MKIGIDIFSFDRPGENYGVGPGVYVWHLLPKLIELGKHHQFIIFTNKDNYDIVPKRKNVKIIINNIPNKIRASRIYHEQIFIPYYFLKNNLDFVHFLGNNISYLIYNKSILTVHDLMWKYYLDRGSREPKWKYFALTVPISIKMAKIIITDSKFIAEEVNNNYKKELKYIYPILLAPGSLIHIDYDIGEQFKNKHNYKFIFTITTSMPHKNLITLLKAFNKLKNEQNYEGKLVVAGQLKGDYYLTTAEYISDNNLEKDILLIGFISEKEKTYCYKHADIVVYPSLYEGFGLPVLEAMEAGSAVIASNAASIPEVGGDACLYFNPKSENDLYEKIIVILNDDILWRTLIKKGEFQYKRFSWDKVAFETLDVYEKIFTGK